MSVPQIPQAAISILTPLSPQTGSGMSRISRFPGPRAVFTNAFMFSSCKFGTVDKSRKSARVFGAGAKNRAFRSNFFPYA
jgi:hypothetical protein